MTQRRILLLLLIAVAGYGALAFLFPRTHPAVGWRSQMDRSLAIELAKKEAERQGLDPRDWKTGIESAVQRNSEYYLNRDPNPVIGPLLSPTVTRVTLAKHQASNSIEVSLANDGRVIGWNRTYPKVNVPVEAQPGTANGTNAETSFSHLTGSAKSRFVTKSIAGADSTNASQYSWELTLADEPRVKMAIAVKMENGTPVEASLNPVFSRDYLESISTRRQTINALTIAWPIFILLALLITLIYYLSNIVRKEVNHRSVVVFLACLFVLVTFWILNSNLFDDIYLSLSQTPQLQRYYLGVALAWLAVTMLSLLLTIPLALAWGAGYPLSARLRGHTLRILEILIRGNVRSRLVGASVLTGLALGWIIPLSSMLIVQSRLFSEAALRSPEGLAGLMTARMPLLTMPTEPGTLSFYMFFFLYVLLVPLITNLLGRPLLVRIGGVIVGATCVVGANFFQSSLPAALLAAAILMLVLDQLTHRAGILAAIVALLAGDYAMRMSTLLVQPMPALQSAGLRGWLVLLAASLVASWVALRGTELGERESAGVWATDAQRANRVDRERIKAEFDVARRAQQQMLPEQPPSFPGFRISAVCRPAREVGGDLYDFIVLPDDRLGIVVADVSGKGVPASLYMTLTKGLLASVSEVSSDPGEILREVNRHLYIACGKRMFVTLLLGVLDRSSRTFRYARAGHNPPVWRQRAEGKTSLLRARGLGLGLNSGEVFNRALTVETIQLGRMDKLFLYSDGITEAMNAQRDEYGEERLMDLAGRLDDLDADQARDAVLKDVSAFLGPTQPQDDQTLVIVEVC